MKIFFLADGGSTHTIKWAKSLAKLGHEIFIYGIAGFNPEIYKDFPGITAVSFGMNTPVTKAGNGSFKKLKYLSALNEIRKNIKTFQPDIVHAHFVSSYGLLAALVKTPKLFMSVWGADVYDFPARSFIHQRVIKFILSKADSIFSTSGVMAVQTSKFTSKKIHVIPFGIDLKKFYPRKVQNPIWSKDDFVIGTVKTLEEKYGITDLVKAFAIAKKKLPGMSLKLLVVGKGSQEILLKSMVKELGIEPDVHFTGWINIDSVPDYHNQLDLAVFPSTLDSESFGVAVVESSACEKPVIVSRKGGLIEVVEENVTGLIVPARDPESLAEAIIKLATNPELRTKLGKAGRERVELLYNWDNNLRDMNSFYQRN